MNINRWKKIVVSAGFKVEKVKRSSILLGGAKTDKRRFLFGIFLILLFGARFMIEYIKNPQEDFEKVLPLDMGQLLSLPFILTGIVLIIMASRKNAREKSEVKG